MRVHLPGAEDDAEKVGVVDGVRVGLGFKAEAAMALKKGGGTFDGFKFKLVAMHRNVEKGKGYVA